MEEATQTRMKVLGRNNKPEVVVRLYEFDDKGFIQIDTHEEGARISSPFAATEGRKRFYRVVQKYLHKGYSQMPDHDAERVIRRGFTPGEFIG